MSQLSLVRILDSLYKREDVARVYLMKHSSSELYFLKIDLLQDGARRTETVATFNSYEEAQAALLQVQQQQCK